MKNPSPGSAAALFLTRVFLLLTNMARGGARRRTRDRRLLTEPGGRGGGRPRVTRETSAWTVAPLTPRDLHERVPRVDRFPETTNVNAVQARRVGTMIPQSGGGRRGTPASRRLPEQRNTPKDINVIPTFPTMHQQARRPVSFIGQSLVFVEKQTHFEAPPPDSTGGVRQRCSAFWSIEVTSTLLVFLLLKSRLDFISSFDVEA